MTNYLFDLPAVLALANSIDLSVSIFRHGNYPSLTNVWNVVLEKQQNEAEIRAKGEGASFQEAFGAAWERFQRLASGGMPLPLLAPPAGQEGEAAEFEESVQPPSHPVSVLVGTPNAFADDEIPF